MRAAPQHLALEPCPIDSKWFQILLFLRSLNVAAWPGYASSSNADMFQPFDMAVDMEVYIGGACNNHPDVWTADQWEMLQQTTPIGSACTRQMLPRHTHSHSPLVAVRGKVAPPSMWTFDGSISTLIHLLNLYLYSQTTKQFGKLQRCLHFSLTQRCPGNIHKKQQQANRISCQISPDHSPSLLDITEWSWTLSGTARSKYKIILHTYFTIYYTLRTKHQIQIFYNKIFVRHNNVH